jgi:hypothetical protein
MLLLLLLLTLTMMVMLARQTLIMELQVGHFMLLWG